jgi:hypothetical protein
VHKCDGTQLEFGPEYTIWAKIVYSRIPVLLRFCICYSMRSHLLRNSCAIVRNCRALPRPAGGSSDFAGEMRIPEPCSSALPGALFFYLSHTPDDN